MLWLPQTTTFPPSLLRPLDVVATRIPAQEASQILAAVWRRPVEDTYGLHHDLAFSPGLPAEITTNFTEDDGIANFGMSDGLTNDAYGVVREVNTDVHLIWLESVDADIGRKTRRACSRTFPT